MHEPRDYNQTDRFIRPIARILGAFGVAASAASHATRPFPAVSTDDALTAQQRRQSGRYMRVNHVGEVCAQALYHSQALTAGDPHIRAQMKQAAVQEADHLAWCEQRIEELGARKSLLNPLWHLGAFTIGGLAGLVGERWNLGFVAETEHQVVRHLDSHLSKLPENDTRSREVVAQMQSDEREHAETAIAAGAAELPQPIKRMMAVAAKVMTSTAHWI